MSTRCPLCDARKVKRFCPAKTVQICPVCCGEKRETEILCPADCVYLQAGREYESGRLAKHSRLPASTPKLWEPAFLERYYGVTLSIWKILAEERGRLNEMVDQDVQLALDGLLRTYKTLESGIYYDHAPEAFCAKSIYQAVKDFLEKANNSIDESLPRLKTGEILDCLQFQKELALAIVLPRPKSRAFLDHIHSKVTEAFPSQKQQSSIVIP